MCICDQTEKKQNQQNNYRENQFYSFYKVKTDFVRVKEDESHNKIKPTTTNISQ